MALFSQKEIACDPAAEIVHLRWADALRNGGGALSGRKKEWQNGMKMRGASREGICVF